ncbi:hypothetical protein CLV92_105266 [Kineococcus xinjiangensis]|uniref:Wadjet protein JetD C-terminal domain-containing protein n=1 Tax=Kineococcus xinjiangensis TaxID=512762 RepID=A0A2S6IPI0_9ACTN|nr:Wadjet anti-phage system protein JetD domain-containing protein [Kineococcus xinjiangensis]PPK96164.1 hypothetical protein CLV92_105266 [Kineococcus xinjiangensis]
MKRPTARTWTEPAEVVARLRRRWEGGSLLRDHLEQRWAPLELPLRAPSARELADHWAEVGEWVSRWRTAPAALRVLKAAVGGRVVGANQLPSRVRVDSPAELWALLGVAAEVRTVEALLDRTATVLPELLDWMRANPLRVLAAAEPWPALLAAVVWIRDYEGAPVHIRQLDAPGVHTKLLNAHSGLLAVLLREVLPPERIDEAAGPPWEARFGFRAKPRLVRSRSLDPGLGLPGGFSDLSVPVAEFHRVLADVRRVLIVENEVTFLALPRCPGTLAVFGSGYRVGTLGAVPWPDDVEVASWGDLDTHGFAILDTLRAHVPGVRSLLMDRATLLVHRDRWGREPKQARADLRRLTRQEAQLYADLRGDVFAPSVRLEQEHVAFGAVEGALARGHWPTSATPDPRTACRAAGGP